MEDDVNKNLRKNIMVLYETFLKTEVHNTSITEDELAQTIAYKLGIDKKVAIRYVKNAIADKVIEKTISNGICDIRVSDVCWKSIYDIFKKEGYYLIKVDEQPCTHLCISGYP